MRGGPRLYASRATIAPPIYNVKILQRNRRFSKPAPRVVYLLKYGAPCRADLIV